MVKLNSNYLVRGYAHLLSEILFIGSEHRFLKVLKNKQ